MNVKFNHEQIATTSALVFFVVLTLIVSCTVWQLVMTICQYDNMSVTKSHSGIVVNVNYQLNKLTTSTNQIRTVLDNINETKR